MWGGLPCIYMRILWKEVFNPIHFKTLFVYPYRYGVQNPQFFLHDF